MPKRREFGRSRVVDMKARRFYRCGGGATLDRRAPLYALYRWRGGEWAARSCRRLEAREAVCWCVEARHALRRVCERKRQRTREKAYVDGARTRRRWTLVSSWSDARRTVVETMSGVMCAGRAPRQPPLLLRHAAAAMAARVRLASGVGAAGSGSGSGGDPPALRGQAEHPEEPAGAPDPGPDADADAGGDVDVVANGDGTSDVAASLLVPDAQREWPEPRAPNPQECCGNGCDPCVWTTYAAEYAAWLQHRSSSSSS